MVDKWLSARLESYVQTLGLSFKIDMTINPHDPYQAFRTSKLTIIDGFHLMSQQLCRCTKQCRKNSFGNLTIIVQNMSHRATIV